MREAVKWLLLLLLAISTQASHNLKGTSGDACAEEHNCKLRHTSVVLTMVTWGTLTEQMISARPVN